MKTIIVPVSGGKDSQVCLSLALKQKGRIIRCVHQNTGYDHPFTYDQLSRMENFYGVAIEHTLRAGGMHSWVAEAGYFPNSAARGCTERLKQVPFKDWLIHNNYNEDNVEIWFGMRSNESKVRSDKYGHLTADDIFLLKDVSSFYGKGKHKHLGNIICRLPIVEWSTDEVFSYINDEGSPLNALYGKGHHRVGCYPCF